MDDQFFSIVQKEFSHLSQVHYFNAAYFGPSPQRAKAYVDQAMQEEMNSSFYPYDRWIHIPDELRKKIALLANVEAENIFHSTSVSEIQSILTRGLSFRPNDCYCVVEGEYPSNVMPWLILKEKKLIDVHIMPHQNIIDVAYLEKNLPRHCKIFSLSHVCFSTGRKIDLLSLGEYLQRRGIIFIVDGTQYFGSGSLSKANLKFVDVYACSTYKWLLGPYGHAFCYLSPQILDRIDCYYASWVKRIKSTLHLTQYQFNEEKGAYIFDRGQAPNRLTMRCLEASLDLFLELGKIQAVEDYNHQLVQYFIDQLPDKKFTLLTSPENLSSIVCLKAKSKIDSEKVKDQLQKLNIDISVREGNMRISFHLYNTKKQIDYLVKNLDKI